MTAATTTPTLEQANTATDIDRYPGARKDWEATRNSLMKHLDRYIGLAEHLPAVVHQLAEADRRHGYCSNAIVDTFPTEALADLTYWLTANADMLENLTDALHRARVHTRKLVGQHEHAQQRMIVPMQFGDEAPVGTPYTMESIANERALRDER